MSLYESISNNMNSKKDIMEMITMAESIYKDKIKAKQDLYVKIVDMCPYINEEDNSDMLDFLEFLKFQLSMLNTYPKDVIETYLISKDYDKKAKNFHNLLDLIIEFIS